MAKLIIHQEKIKDPKELTTICPFGAMEEKDGRVSINAACKMCRLCVKKGPAGAVEYVEEKEKKTIDKSQWNGIAVYVDHVDGEIHPVTYELIGKARELAAVIKHPVYALFMGSKIKEKAEELLHYGVDKVFVYDNPQLDHVPLSQMHLRYAVSALYALYAAGSHAPILRRQLRHQSIQEYPP